MNPTAFGLAIVGMVAYGLWAVLAEQATRTLAPESAVVASYGTAALLVGGYLLVTGVDAPARSGLTYALVGGVFLAVGAVTYYRGLALGSTAVVSTLTGLFFVVAALVGVLVFGETLQLTDLVGFGFAVLAVVFIAI